jgi:hypothetical protein
MICSSLKPASIHLRSLSSGPDSSNPWRRNKGSRQLLQLDPLWDQLFPAEQARIVQLLVERVDVRVHGVEVRLRPNGLTGLVREVAGSRRAAA